MALVIVNDIPPKHQYARILKTIFENYCSSSKQESLPHVNLDITVIRMLGDKKNLERFLKSTWPEQYQCTKPTTFPVFHKPAKDSNGCGVTRITSKRELERLLHSYRERGLTSCIQRSIENYPVTVDRRKWDVRHYFSILKCREKLIALGAKMGVIRVAYQDNQVTNIYQSKQLDPELQSHLDDYYREAHPELVAHLNQKITEPFVEKLFQVLRPKFHTLPENCLSFIGLDSILEMNTKEVVYEGSTELEPIKDQIKTTVLIEFNYGPCLAKWIANKLYQNLLTEGCETIFGSRETFNNDLFYTIIERNYPL